MCLQRTTSIFATNRSPDHYPLAASQPNFVQLPQHITAGVARPGPRVMLQNALEDFFRFGMCADQRPFQHVQVNSLVLSVRRYRCEAEVDEEECRAGLATLEKHVRCGEVAVHYVLLVQLRYSLTDGPAKKKRYS